MKRKLFFLAAMMLATIMNLQAADPVSYLYPEYNTSGDPKSGIKEWKTGSCTEYTVVDDASTIDTLNAGWYVVNGTDVKLTAGAICIGAVHLILADGAKLTSMTCIKVADIAGTPIKNSLTIYGQTEQTGQLIAMGGTNNAGIGGAGADGDGKNITINGGTVTATGGNSCAGIGGREGSPGSDITINGGTVTATGNGKAAGIGGGGETGRDITINGGIVTAMGGSNGAGIGGGQESRGIDITINGGTITATGGNGAAGIGSGAECEDYSFDIFVNPFLILKAGSSANPTDVIAHATITTDVAFLLADKQYATAKPVYKITTSVNKSDRGYTTPRDTAVFYGDTVIIRAEAYYGYHFTRWVGDNTENPRKVVVTKDTNYQAVFSHNKYELTVSASGPGSVTGGGSYAYKYTTTITATPNPNCQFIQWNDGNTDNPRDITLTQDTAFVASFSGPDTLDYLHFISLKENCSVQLKQTGFPDAVNVEYSKDNRKSWNNLIIDTAIDFDNAGDTIWFRAGKNGIPGTNATFSQSVGKCYNFAFGANDSIAAGGNTMSLLDATCELKTMPIAGFTYLFKGATQLISAPELPATTLASSCYNSMFKNSGLVVAPELPATILAGECYYSMFLSCANLETAPDSLPADSLAMSCYMAMFMDCAKLKNAPVMKIKVLGRSCFSSMFQGCTSLQVDTIDGNCDGAELTIPTTSAPTWNSYMFKDCHEYAITQLGGSYCISEWKGPRAVELKSVDSTRVYDGTPFVADSVIITGQMNRNNIQFKNFASQTSVGQQPNTFEYTLLMGSAADYAFDTVYGTLTVDFINSASDPIRVKIDKNEKTYDGEPLFASYSVEGGLAQGDSMALVMDTTELTESDYIAVKALSMQILRGDQVMNAGYVVAPIENGSLRVKAREVTLTSGSASKLYDGTPLTNNTVEESGDGFLEGHGATYDVTGTQTKIGVSDNKFTYTLNEGTDANNYNITTVYGVLAVGIKLEARIVPMYDGWNIVLDKAALEDSLLNYGVVVSLTDENVSWYHVMDDVDAFDNLLGVAGNDRAAVPFKGLFHTEDKAMDGQYYAVVRVDEALPVMGARFFRSNIVNMNAAKAAPYRPDGDKQGYDILGRPVHNGYQGIIIYNNGEKVVK